MNDYTLNIQFFIGMNYFFQKELGNLDFFSFFSSKVAIAALFLVSSTQNFSENSVNFETIPSSFGRHNGKYLPLLSLFTDQTPKG